MTILYGVYIVIIILLIIVILMQKSKTRGFGVMTGITAVGDSYYNKNKSKTKEGRLESLTKVGIFVFIVLAVVLNVMINKETGTTNNVNTPNTTTTPIVPVTPPAATTETTPVTEPTATPETGTNAVKPPVANQ
ncbi:MAG: preprotein translocase subunit SecG [Clostridiales bacterium GWE2_32_10]|nr:MAG: preprotein translocase subunit SecG [Clostridiales bacterium GWE2_32_10]HBY20439.1 preprotein translocase subunit SecG [Clostridiales bacterium]